MYSVHCTYSVVYGNVWNYKMQYFKLYSEELYYTKAQHLSKTSYINEVKGEIYVEINY